MAVPFFFQCCQPSCAYLYSRPIHEAFLANLAPHPLPHGTSILCPSFTKFRSAQIPSAGDSSTERLLQRDYSAFSAAGRSHLWPKCVAGVAKWSASIQFSTQFPGCELAFRLEPQLLQT